MNQFLTILQHTSQWIVLVLRESIIPLTEPVDSIYSHQVQLQNGLLLAKLIVWEFSYVIVCLSETYQYKLLPRNSI